MIFELDLSIHFHFVCGAPDKYPPKEESSSTT